MRGGGHGIGHGRHGGRGGRGLARMQGGCQMGRIKYSEEGHRFCLMRSRYSSDIRHGVGAGCNASRFIFSRAQMHWGSANNFSCYCLEQIEN